MTCAHDRRCVRPSLAGALRLASAALCLAAWCSAPISAGSAFAAVQNSGLEVSPDGATIGFEVHDTPRRDMMEQLFAGTGIEFRWMSTQFADERVSIKFSGSAAALVRQLLNQTDFVIGYDENSRPSRVIIVGQATKEQGSPTLAALAAALQQANPPKPAARPEPVNKDAAPKVADVAVAALQDATRPRQGIRAAPAEADAAQNSADAAAAPTQPPAPPTQTAQAEQPSGEAQAKNADAAAAAPVPVITPGSLVPQLTALAESFPVPQAGGGTLMAPDPGTGTGGGAAPAVPAPAGESNNLQMVPAPLMPAPGAGTQP